MKIYYLIMTLFVCTISIAQTTITGSVRDKKNQSIAGANVKVVGEKSGTSTDFDGNFTLKVSSKTSVTLEVTSVGFVSQTVSATAGQKVNVALDSEDTKLDEIVVSASRTPEKIRESPVTVERMGAKEIRKTASPTFYDGLENLKEVQMNTSSMSFKSINTRGFASIANTRFMQLVDGMDNSSPLLNFVLGNLIGMSEIDVQSVEILPGASSALYGANAFNGILFMTSKSPFVKQGISAYVKYGQTNQQAAGVNDYYDFGIRAAKAFTPYFAAKANFTFLRGTDWNATNYDDVNIAGKDRGFYNYNGVNVYGDEASTNLAGVGSALVQLGAITAAQASVLPNYNVSRTGYNEVDLTDNKVQNVKADVSLHFKPFANDFEIIWQTKVGSGNTVYQGANRYYLNNFFMQQHKLEVKGKNFFVRGYTTTEDGGKSYDMLFTGLNVNRQWKADNVWFGQYAGAYIQSTLLGGATPEQAHATARRVADTGRLLPGTDAFKSAFNKVTADADVLQGSRLQDNSRIYHSDANYNFKDLFKAAEVQVGGSFRLYELNSGGRIYTDGNGQINYNEYGFYTQVQKKLMEDRLKFTGSVRYDKSKNFDGNFSPRISAVYSAGESKQHNFRASFQTGFRNPTTQDQYIGFNVGNAVLIGSAPDNLTRYIENSPVTGAVGQSYAGGTSVTITGLNAYNNSYTKASVDAFAAFAAANPGNTPGAAALLRKTNVAYVKPETVKAFELGYRGVFRGFGYDINGYYNIYNNFIGNLTVVAPKYGTVSEVFDFVAGAPTYATNPAVQTLQALSSGNIRAFQIYTNTDNEIKSVGFGLGLSKKVYKEFELSGNYNYADFKFDQSKDASFEPGFNTPKHRIKCSLSNERLFKNFGFNVSGRYSSAFMWQSTFTGGDGMIAEATVIDAQISYGIPMLKSVFKAGGTNLGGKEYQQVFGAGQIGQQYFVSWTINP